MLRFILRRSFCHDGNMRSHLETYDFDFPELQSLLTRGGFGGADFDMTELEGVEVIQYPNKEANEALSKIEENFFVGNRHTERFICEFDIVRDALGRTKAKPDPLKDRRDQLIDEQIERDNG